MACVPCVAPTECSQNQVPSPLEKKNLSAIFLLLLTEPMALSKRGKMFKWGKEDIRVQVHPHPPQIPAKLGSAGQSPFPLDPYFFSPQSLTWAGRSTQCKKGWLRLKGQGGLQPKAAGRKRKMWGRGPPGRGPGHVSMLKCVGRESLHTKAPSIVHSMLGILFALLSEFSPPL